EPPRSPCNTPNELIPPPLLTTPTDRDKDYALIPHHVTHDFRSFGSFDLPLGPGRTFFRNSSGFFAREIEGWQTSFIVNLSTGQPVSVGSTYINGTTVSPTGLYGGSVPDIVGPFPVKGFGKVQWNGDFGNFFGDAFSKVADPQCGLVAAELKQFCTLQAVTDAKT